MAGAGGVVIINANALSIPVERISTKSTLERRFGMIINANALNIPLADGCVNTIVTSPPY